MPRGNPAYRHHKSSGQAIVVLNGRMLYLGKYGTPESYEEYARVMAEWRANGHCPPPRGPVLTVLELSARFLAHAARYHVRPDGTQTTEVREYRLALKLLRRLYGSTPAADFGPLALKAVRQAMIDQGLARRTVNARTARIVRCFRWGTENELVPGGVYQALRSVPPLPNDHRCPAKRDRVIGPADPAHVAAVLPHLTGVLRAMVLLMRLTGARAGEICLLKTADVDRSGDVWVYSPTWHKNAHRGQPRLIYLGPKAQAVLGPFLRPDEPFRYVFRPADSWAESARSRRKDGREPNGGCGGERYRPERVSQALYAAREGRRRQRPRGGAGRARGRPGGATFCATFWRPGDPFFSENFRSRTQARAVRNPFRLIMFRPGAFGSGP